MCVEENFENIFEINNFSAPLDRHECTVIQAAVSSKWLDRFACVIYTVENGITPSS